MTGPNNTTDGKIFLITGGSSDVGEATAIAIAQRGAKVVIVSRSEARGQAALDEIALKTGNHADELMTADLSLQSSVRALAAAFKQRYDRLDGLMNLAGGIYFKKDLTQEGIDQSFAVNYLSHFLLTHELLDILKASAPARVVTVSGNPAFIKRAKLDFASLQGTNKYSGMTAAAQAMFARVFFAFELARKLKGTGVTSVTFNPGVIQSNLTAGAPFFMKVVAALYKPFEKDVCEVGGWLAMDPSVENTTGVFYDDKKRIVPFHERFDPSVGKQLWTLSEGLTGVSKP